MKCPECDAFYKKERALVKHLEEIHGWGGVLFHTDKNGVRVYENAHMILTDDGMIFDVNNKVHSSNTRRTKMSKMVINIKTEDYDVYQMIEENLDSPHFMKMMADEDYFIERALGILENFTFTHKQRGGEM